MFGTEPRPRLWKTETLLPIHESKYMSGGVHVLVVRGRTLLLRSRFWHIRSGMEGGVMIAKLVEAIFGCRHSHYSFPVTMRGAKRRPQAAMLTGTYVVCLECGREFPYDWQEMKVITSPERHREHLAELAKHVA